MKLFEVKSYSFPLISFVLFSKEKPDSAPESRKALLVERCCPLSGRISMHRMCSCR